MNKQKKQKNASLVWTHFKKDTEGRNACVHDKCEKSYGATTATTALIIHLYNAHDIDLQEERKEFVIDRSKKQKRGNESESNSEEDEASNKCEALKPSKTQKYKNKTQKAINDKLLRFVVMDLQAFHVCSSQPCDLVEMLDPKWTMPNSHTIRSLMIQNLMTKNC